MSDNNFFIRELSLLEFNKRVVLQASDKSVPILERLKYLCIADSNLDEFFEIKVAFIRKKLKYSDGLLTSSDESDLKLFKDVRRKANSIIKLQYDLLQKSVFRALRTKNIIFLRRRELNSNQREWANKYFDEHILPIINPMILEGDSPEIVGSHPFPKIQNKSLNFMIKLKGTDDFGNSPKLAVVPAPRILSRYIQLPKKISNNKDCYMFLSSIIHENIDKLFPGLKVRGCHQFRVTMNSNLVFDDEDLNDIKKSLTRLLPDRKYSEAVRLEVVKDCPKDILKFLKNQYFLSDLDIYKINGPVNLNRFYSIYEDIDKKNLKFPIYKPKPVMSSFKNNKDYFNNIKDQDILLHHPYNDFDHINDFIKAAVKDKNTVAIKQTLYRTAINSKIINALVKAAKKDIAVTVVIELRAKFDEETNIKIAKKLEDAGVQVTYGLKNFKTHAKALLIVRKENGTLVNYFHLGTGNYHENTAKLYTDFSLISANKEISADVNKFFLQLTGSNKDIKYNHLFLSPIDSSKKVIKLISNEIENKKNKHDAYIKIKMNQLTERKIINKLYEASQAGVKIELFVRGECILKPGISGLSENIKVYSTIGRFLEHSRVLFFCNKNRPKLYLSSADWMTRNMHNRVEIFFPILEQEKMDRIIFEAFELQRNDNVKLWKLDSFGKYIKKMPSKGNKKKHSQHMLCKIHGALVD